MKTWSRAKNVGETLNNLDDLRKSLKPNMMNYSLGWKWCDIESNQIHQRNIQERHNASKSLWRFRTDIMRKITAHFSCSLSTLHHTLCVIVVTLRRSLVPKKKRCRLEITKNKHWSKEGEMKKVSTDLIMLESFWLNLEMFLNHFQLEIAERPTIEDRGNKV